MRGATQYQHMQHVVLTYFYSHTSCEVQQKKCCSGFTIPIISTHTPHARCNNGHLHLSNHINISTHTPHARCNTVKGLFSNTYKFLLTHLMRGATAPDGTISREVKDFYSHTSCEVQHYIANADYLVQLFLLTHLMRGATTALKYASLRSVFLLTHLMRGAT